MSTNLLEVKSLTRHFDVSKPWITRVTSGEGKRTLVANEDVSFNIERGKTFALVGESGSGKSTIAKMVVGLLDITAGSVLIDGTNLATAVAAESTALRQRIQMIFQSPYASLNPRWRIGNLIGEPLNVFNIGDEKGRKSRIGELLEQVGLSAADARKFPHEFSGGQRQRICIARALASKPDFIVCDEPTSALDVSVQAQVLNLLKNLQSELGLTYLFITHDLAVVRFMADSVGVLYLGRLVEQGPSDYMFNSPRHPYTQMLLASAPNLDQIGVERIPFKGEIPDPINRPSGCYFHPRCDKATKECKVSYPEQLETANSHVQCFHPA